MSTMTGPGSGRRRRRVRSRRASASVLVVALAVLGVAACGDADDTGSTATAETSTEPSAGTATPATDGPVETTPATGTEAPPDDGGGGDPSDLDVGVDTVVRFEPGATSATISEAVIRGERNRHVLEAAAGRTLDLSITSLEDNAVVDLYGPDGALLASEVTSASVELPADGAYTVLVGGTRGNATYELTIEIPA